MNNVISRCNISILNLIRMLKKLFRGKMKDGGRAIIKERSIRNPLFTSSFIQNWYAKDFTLERWIDELQMLKEIGVREIILQSIVDTKNKYAVYPTKINGYSVSEKNMILFALDAAKIVGIKVRVGLGESDDWWKKGWYDLNWLRQEAEINKKIINEVFEKYGYHKAFGGWYIPYEFSEYFCAMKSQQVNLNFFYKSISKEVKSKNSNLSIMIAPFYNSKVSIIGDLKLWSKAVQGVIINTGIDIVSLQDSVGAGFNTIDNIGMIFYHTKQATDSLGITLYADTETFISTDNGNVPETQDQIFKRMSEVNSYVEGFIAFSIDHFQNKNVVSQISNYEDYLEYYNENKIV